MKSIISITTIILLLVSYESHGQVEKYRRPDIFLLNKPPILGDPKADFDWFAIQNFDWNSPPPRWVYDKDLHTYGNTYVHPKGYRVYIDSRSSVHPITKPISRYHWKIEKKTRKKFIFSPSKYRYQTVYDKYQMYPILSLTQTITGDTTSITYRMAAEPRSPESETPFPTDDFVPTVAFGPMLPSQGTYRVTLELISDYVSWGNVIATVTKEIIIKDHVFVIFGDSNASGEGNPDIEGVGGDPYGTTFDRDECNTPQFSRTDLPFLGTDEIGCERDPVWIEPKGHRSRLSGHFRAARNLMQKNPKSFFTILSFANSGASIFKGLLQRQHDWQETGQIDEARKTLNGRRVDYILMSMGINQIEFADWLERMVVEWHVDAPITPSVPPAIPEEIQLDLNAIPSLLGFEVGRKIKESFSGTSYKVLLTEYPEGLFSNSSKEIAQGCELFGDADDEDNLQLALGEALEVDEASKMLNNKLREAIVAYNSMIDGGPEWVLITGIAEKFRGHGYCTGEATRFFVRAKESCYKQCDWEGTIHPNSAGHRVTAESIATYIQNDFTAIFTITSTLKID